jgi:lysophospholipase L1-like esterase
MTLQARLLASAALSLPLFATVSAQSPEAKVMPLGDSITRGTNDRPPPNGDIPGGYRRELGVRLDGAGFPYDFVGEKNDNPAPGADPDHNGNNGFTNTQIANNITAWLSVNPDVVLLKTGTNDILQDVSVATAAEKLSALIVSITNNAPHRRLYVSTILPITQGWRVNGVMRPPEYLNGNANAYNTEVRNIVQAHASQGRNVTLVDMNASIVLTGPTPAENFYQPGDGVHPGQAGYNQMGTIWFNAINARGGLFEPPPEGAPAAPTGLSAVIRSGTRIDLKWTDAAEDETGFQIVHKTGANGSWEEIATPAADSVSAVLQDLATETDAHAFAIRAGNASGWSAWSGIIAAALPAPPVSYSSWRDAQPGFPGLAPQEREAEADPNNDGIPNLLAYGLALDPLTFPPAGSLPVLIPGENEEFFFRYRCSKSAAVSCQVQISGNLEAGSWQTVDDSEASYEDIPGDEAAIDVVLPLPAGEDARFARLKVVLD